MVFNASYLENQHGEPLFFFLGGGGGFFAKVDLYLTSQ